MCRSTHRFTHRRQPVSGAASAWSGSHSCSHRLGRILDSLFRRLSNRDERAGHRLGPFQRRTLTLGVERRLPPGAQPVDPLLGLAEGARVLGVHVEAVGTAVDLRCADLHQLHQGVLESAGLHLALQREHRLAEAGFDVVGRIDSRCHVFLLGYL